MPESRVPNWSAVDEIEIEAAALVAGWPACLVNGHKIAIARRIDDAVGPHRGVIRYVRHSAPSLPEIVSLSGAAGRVTIRCDAYDHAPAADGCVDWHLLFVPPQGLDGYSGSHLGQAEWMMVEHPSIGSLREHLRSLGRPASFEEAGVATPVTIGGVVRRCRLDARGGLGSDDGIAGARFALATRERVLAAVTPLVPPTLSNLVALAAPECGVGEYWEDEIRHILRTAWAGWQAVRRESGTRRVCLHSGLWGCGRLGGNRALMVATQVLAAGAAGVDEVVMHVPDAADVRNVQRGLEVVAALETSLGPAPRTDAVIDSLLQRRFRWELPSTS